MLLDLETSNSHSRFKAQRKSGLSRGVLMVLVGTILVYLAFTFTIPLDLYSTALFYDNVGWNIIMSTPTTSIDLLWFSMTLRLPVTEEALYFSVFMFIAQVAVAFPFSYAGPFVSGGRRNGGGFLSMIVGGVKREVRLEDVNTIKVTWLLVYLLLAFLDTYTDYVFRTATGIPFTVGQSFFQVIMLVLVYNLGSEFAISYGMNSAVIGLQDIIDQFDGWMSFLDPARDALSKRRGSGGSISRSGGKKNRSSGGNSPGGRPPDQSRAREMPPVPNFDLDQLNM